jgi:hypothetical protein
MEAERQARQQADDQAKCDRFGYARGSDAFADCMMNLAQTRERQKAQAERDRQMAAEREKDRQARKEARQQQASSAPGGWASGDDQTLRNIKQGEALENDEARKAGVMPATPTATSNMNCTTTTTTTGSGNNVETHEETHCH